MQSYGEILNRMTDYYREKTGTEPDRASDIGIRMEILAGEVFKAYSEMNWLKNQMFPETAEGEYLDLHAGQRGLKRKNGTKSTGSVDFILERPLSYDVEIPQGTIVAAGGDEPVQFITLSSAMIYSGRLAVTVDIEAVEEGSGGNVRSGEINIMVTPVLGVDRVENGYAAENGSDRESDEALRARVIDSFVNISNGTNIAFYKKTAMAIDGVVAAGVIPRNRGAGTVDVFVTTSDGEPSEELLERVRNVLRSEREVNVDIEVGALELVSFDVYVYLGVKDGWNFNDVRSSCETAVEEYFRTLSAGEQVYLSKIGECIQHVEGVDNYLFERNLTSESAITEDKIFCPGHIFIMERGAY